MFSEAEREELRQQLLERGRHDERISGGALTGSASRGELDRWSDIDLAFGVHDADKLTATLADFTDYMRSVLGAVDTVDVRRDPWVYRVFLLPSTLQVDLAFAPASDFGALASTFRLVFGSARDRRELPGRDPREVLGYGWLYALHVRSSIARNRPWQALYMLNQMRDQIAMLACLAASLPASEGRGVDDLPVSEKRQLEATVPRSLDRAELALAFAAAGDALMAQAVRVDPELAARLEPVIRLLAHTARPK
jgi:predicted nucleotidyltransferase